MCTLKLRSRSSRPPVEWTSLACFYSVCKGDQCARQCHMLLLSSERRRQSLGSAEIHFAEIPFFALDSSDDGKLEASVNNWWSVLTVGEVTKNHRGGGQWMTICCWDPAQVWQVIMLPLCGVERATLLSVMRQQIVTVLFPLLQGLPDQISLLISPVWMMAVKISNQDCRMRKVVGALQHFTISAHTVSP